MATTSKTNVVTDRIVDKVDRDFRGKYALQLQNSIDLAAKGAGIYFNGVDAVITVADNANLDFGDGNGAIEVLVCLLDVTDDIRFVARRQSATDFIYFMYDEGGGTLTAILKDGGTTLHQAAVPWTPSVGVWYHLIFTFANGVANALYINGKKQTLTTDIATGGTQEITADLWLARFDANYYNEQLSLVRLWNNYLTTTEAKAYSSGAPLKFEHIGASQTPKVLSDFSTDEDGWSVWRGAIAGDIDAIGGEDNWLRFTCDNTTSSHNAARGTGVVEFGKRYRLSYKYFIPSGQSNIDGVRFANYSESYFITPNLTVKDVATSGSIEFTSTKTGNLLCFSTDGGVAGFTDAGGDDLFYIKDIVLTRIGAVLQLEQPGIGPTKWLDSSGNSLHGAVSGAVPINLSEHRNRNQVNLIKNAFGVWSNSDTDKGLGSMNYDAGDENGQAIPTPGDLCTGGTSGATGKIISISIDSGAFADTDATGTIVLGACQGRFHDNETITIGSGETVVVNMPDSAAGVDLIQNGEFSVDDDPPDGWTDVRAILTTEGVGQVGNCLMVETSGAATGYAYQDITVIPGKLYIYLSYFKKGTASSGNIQIFDQSNLVTIKQWLGITDVAWTLYTHTFEAPVGCTIVRLYHYADEAVATKTAYYDEISVYEITPCCTAADALACDGFQKDNTLDVYREHSGNNTKDGEFYALKLVPSAEGDYFRWPVDFRGNAEFYKLFAGRTVTWGAWVKSSTANDLVPRVDDGVIPEDGPEHTGSGDWEWIEKTLTMNDSPTRFQVQFRHINANPGIAYISQPMLVFGSSIGEGNYVPSQDKVIEFEDDIKGNKFHGVSGLGDEDWTDLNVEADTDGKLPKNIESITLHIVMRDSGSDHVSDAAIGFRPAAAGGATRYTGPTGLLDNAYSRTTMLIACGAVGDFGTLLDASGADTMDFITFKYVAVKLR